MIEYVSFEYNYFWIVYIAVSLEVVNVFVFHALNSNALVYRFQHIRIPTLRKCFGQKGHRLPKCEGARTPMSVLILLILEE